MAGDYSTVGRDLVNHCVNDILVQGAEPLFFLDYVGAGVLEPERWSSWSRGVADGCRENGCALLGGETAEMPGFYQPGDYELVGFIVGVVDRARSCSTDRACASGDVLVGLPSAGLHTNGYSLARAHPLRPAGPRASATGSLAQSRSRTVGEHAPGAAPLLPRAARPLLGDPSLHAMAHITGGGLTDNVPRILPGGTPRLDPRRRAGRSPSSSAILQESGEVADEEMLRVFNMGIGMVLVVDPAGLREVLARLRDAGQKSFAHRHRAAGRLGRGLRLGRRSPSAPTSPALPE